MQLPTSAAGGAKAAGLSTARVKAADSIGSSRSAGKDTSSAYFGGSGHGGTEAEAEAKAARLAAATTAGRGREDASFAGFGDPTLGDWDSGQMPGVQSWGDSAPDGKLLGESVFQFSLYVHRASAESAYSCSPGVSARPPASCWVS